MLDFPLEVKMKPDELVKLPPFEPRGWEDILGAWSWEPRLIEILRRHVEEIVTRELNEAVTSESMIRAARIFKLRIEEKIGHITPHLKHWALEQTGDVIR
jgi:hypothetical protein